MLFNPLFLQNESGSENKFIAKPGTLKKKGYLFADIMKVYFNGSGKAGTVNSKFNITTENNVGKTGKVEQKQSTPLTLLNDENTSTSESGKLLNTTEQANSLIANTPTAKVSLSKLENIFSKLFGNNGEPLTGDLKKLINQLVSQINSEGEVVLSVEQNGEKVAVDVSKIKLPENEISDKAGKKPKAKKTALNNYAIKIVAIPQTFNLSNLTQKISDTANEEVNVSEINKVSIPISGKKGKRTISVYSIVPKLIKKSVTDESGKNIIKTADVPQNNDSNINVVSPVKVNSENKIVADSKNANVNITNSKSVKQKLSGVVSEVVKNDKNLETLSKGLIIGFGAGDITYQIRGIA